MAVGRVSGAQRNAHPTIDNSFLPAYDGLVKLLNPAREIKLYSTDATPALLKNLQIRRPPVW